ncbi:kunitz trypsin inhibitor 5-like [Mangifera indica]|uniref:kunitz trypsin inhibitor 5-like n=1 Tax=Mangifera indica TaxID=29780 RepID=UPI001CFA3D0B|nr:kunitz trypsin inhibitor 5-like [Mangifera indica]
MAIKRSPLLQLSFIFFAFITEQSPAANTPVLDFTGEVVLTGTEYYILTTSQLPARTCSGLSLFNGKTSTCPLNVIQEQLEFQKGAPLIFSHGQGGVVYESLHLNIKFSALESVCNQSTVWRIGGFDSSTGQWFVTGGGVEGDQCLGVETRLSWFKIEKASAHAYKIAHCPLGCESFVSMCMDVGIYLGGGVRHLALSQTPLSVVFIKGSVNNK